MPHCAPGPSFDPRGSRLRRLPRGLRRLHRSLPHPDVCTVGEFLDKIVYYFHKGPKALAAAKATMEDITWSQDQVAIRENERANAKRKARLQANREKANREAVTNGSARVRKVRKLR